MAEACAPATRPLLPVSGPCGDGRGGRLATSGGACPCVPTSHCWRWPGLDSELGDQGRDVEPFGCPELARGAEMQRCQRRALDTAQCPLDVAHWTLHVRPRRGAPCSPPPALACQPGQRGCRRPPRAFAPGEASVCRAQQGRVSDPPSHGRFVPSPRHCHSEFCGPPRGRGAPLWGPHAAVPRLVRPWPSFRGVTGWSGLVALCLRCRSVVCLAGGQRDPSPVAWVTGGGAPLPLVTESVLAVH